MSRDLLRRTYRRLADVPVVGQILDQYSSLRYLTDRKIALLGVANFLDTMSTTIIVPLLPGYAERLGASAVLIGIIFAAPAAAKMTLNTPFGYLADQTNRRRWIVLGMAVGGVSVMLLGLVGIPLVFVALRALDGVGEAMKGPATNTYIGDVVPEDERGSAFGAYRTLGTLGMIVGPALGGLLAVIGDLSTPFLVLGTVSVFSSLLLYLLLPPADGDVEQSEESSEGLDLSLSEFRALVSIPIAGLLFDAFVSAVGTNAFFAFFAVLLEQNYGVGSAFVGFTWSVFGLSLFLFIPVGGTFTDRAGRKPALILSKVGWAVVVVGLALATNPVVPIGLLLLGGLASAFLGPAWSALIYELAPEGKEGTLMGLNGTFNSGGSAIGPILGGVVAHLFGVQSVFYAMGAIWILTVGIVVFVLPETRGSDGGAVGGAAGSEG